MEKASTNNLQNMSYEEIESMSIDEKREHDKRLREESSKLRGKYQSEEERKHSRQHFEKQRAIKELDGIDRRKYSIQFVESHRSVGRIVPHEVKGLLLVMATLLETKGNGAITNRKYEKLGIEEISKKLGKHRNTISPLLDRLVNEFGLVEENKEGKSKVYKLNSNLYACGKQEGAMNFVRMYQTEILNVSKHFNLVELGFLSDLLNYMHCKHHILLQNPEEVHESDMEILRPKDIAKLFNMETQVVNKYIRKLITKKVLIRLEIGTGRSIAKVLIVSPGFFSKTAKIINLDIIKSIVDETTLSSKNYIK
ncbi:hypothetical protein [Bacillus pseudomycoides]|uniref:hypothetical protein n=1 Tax=Bacillus pseudomycoides TaxID=64104 RepID=UPI0003169D15|nr:hypothetical protein [Bacillus pseudomycoides]MED1621672.1 hypothetical protein [Bacillus pseudomycoides]PGC43494.1 hypothetical protein COM18_04010 [Bacillus pseudomycoides]